FDLELGPIALAFCGVGSPEDLAQIATLTADPERWFPAAWLAYKGLSAAAEIVRRERERTDHHVSTSTPTNGHRQTPTTREDPVAAGRVPALRPRAGAHAPGHTHGGGADPGH